MWSLVHEAAHDDGAAVLAASHDRDAEPYCDRMLELRAGRLIDP